MPTPVVITIYGVAQKKEKQFIFTLYTRAKIYRIYTSNDYFFEKVLGVMETNSSRPHDWSDIYGNMHVAYVPFFVYTPPHNKSVVFLRHVRHKGCNLCNCSLFSLLILSLACVEFSCSCSGSYRMAVDFPRLFWCVSDGTENRARTCCNSWYSTVVFSSLSDESIS